MAKNADFLIEQPTEQDRAMFEFYKQHPDLACIDLLNQDLAPFQRKVIKGSLSHSFVLNVLARGSGKTRIMGYIAALEAMFNPRKNVGFLAPAFRSAKLSFNELEAIIDQAPYLQACIKKVQKLTDAYTVYFWNGAKIIAQPMAMDSKLSLRGTRLHTALIDEYPHVTKEAIDAIITPMLATQRDPMANVRRIQKQKKLLAKGLINKEDLALKRGANKVIGFSSAYFQYNHMYKTICDYRQLGREQLKKTGKTDYAVYVFNYLDAPEGFFDVDMINHAKATADSVVFDMEYLSKFPSDTEGFYPRSLIDSCCARGKDVVGLEKVGKASGRYFLGIDPARSQDNFAISILKLVDQTMYLVRNITYHKTPFPEIAQYIRHLTHEYNIELIGIDSGGGGLAMKDLLANPMTTYNKDEILLDADDETNIGKTGRKIIKLINFSSTWVGEANHDMRASMQHGRLKFPPIFESSTYIKPEADILDVEDQMNYEFLSLVKELQSIKATLTKTGIMHFDTENQHSKKDRYSSLLIGHKILYDYIRSGFQKRELASGGWLGARGLTDDPEEEQYPWELTKSVDEIKALEDGPRTRVEDGSLI